MNLPSIIVLLAILVMVVVAIRRLRMDKGRCSCEDSMEKTAYGDKCSSCSADCPLKNRRQR